MGWIFWEVRMPPNRPDKQILMLDARYNAVFVGPASDFNYRILKFRQNGGKREELWTEFWMPIPVPPPRVIRELCES